MPSGSSISSAPGASRARRSAWWVGTRRSRPPAATSSGRVIRAAASSRVSFDQFLAHLGLGGRAGAVLERGPGLRRQDVPVQRPLVRPGQRHRGLYSRLVGRGPGRVVAAQADPEPADPGRVDVVAPLQVVRDRAGHPLVGGLDRQLVLGLALAGPVDRDDGQAAVQHVLRRGLQFFLHRVQPGHHDHDGGPGLAGRNPEVGRERGAFVPDADRLGGGRQGGRAAAEAGHRAVVGRALLFEVIDEDELAPVPAQRGAPPGVPGGHRAPGRLGRPGQLLVVLGGPAPLAAPVVPDVDAGHGFVKSE